MSGTGEKPLILVIDDRAELLAAVSEMLSVNYTVIGVTSYHEAMEVLSIFTPALFLIDIEIPTYDGYDITALLRKQEKYQKIPIVFLTGRADKASVIKAVNTGGNDYIVKPLKQSILLKKIKTYLD